MIGRQMMGRIDSRFRQAASSDDTLGNISVIAVGDPGQCEAIGDQQFYDTNPHHGTGDMQEAAAMSNTGLDIWQQFDDVFPVRDFLPCVCVPTVRPEPTNQVDISTER